MDAINHPLPSETDTHTRALATYTMSHLQGDDTDKEQVVQLEHAEEVVPLNTLEDGNVKKRFHANHQLDDAKRLLEEAGGQHEFSLEDRKRVLRKIDLFVCVPMCLVYWIREYPHGSILVATFCQWWLTTDIE